MSMTPSSVSQTSKTLHRVAGSSGGVHTVAREEQVAYTGHINNTLGNVNYLVENGYLPIVDDSVSVNLYEKLSDGHILAHLIAMSHPDAIDLRALNVPRSGSTQLNAFQKSENINLVLSSARSIGCSIVNIHAVDITDSVKNNKHYLVLGVLWQIIRSMLFSKINLRAHPELVVLLREGEDLATFMKLPEEEILLRWFNYHLEREGVDPIRNMNTDLKDSMAYGHLLHSIDPSCSDPVSLSKMSLEMRAEAVISSAKNKGIPVILSGKDICNGHRRLNLAFVASIFNTCPGLEIKQEEAQQITEAAEMLEEKNDMREQRVFRNWLNSLGIIGRDGNVVVVNDIVSDLSDGVILLQAMEMIMPGITENFSKVNFPSNTGKNETSEHVSAMSKGSLNKYKRVENCNRLVKLGKEKMNLSLTGVGGVDIEAGNVKLMLALLWQLMRLSLFSLLRDLGGGSSPTDADILHWANATVESYTKTNPSAMHANSTSITSFKDPSIASGLFLLNLLTAVNASAVNQAIVTEAKTPEDQASNARYVLSVARKIGAPVYITYEDIVEVKPKMIMSLLASIQSISKKHPGTATPAHTVAKSSELLKGEAVHMDTIAESSQSTKPGTTTSMHSSTASIPRSKPAINRVSFPITPNGVPGGVGVGYGAPKHVLQPSSSSATASTKETATVPTPSSTATPAPKVVVSSSVPVKPLRPLPTAQKPQNQNQMDTSKAESENVNPNAMAKTEETAIEAANEMKNTPISPTVDPPKAPATGRALPTRGMSASVPYREIIE